MTVQCSTTHVVVLFVGARSGCIQISMSLTSLLLHPWLWLLSSVKMKKKVSSSGAPVAGIVVK